MFETTNQIGFIVGYIKLVNSEKLVYKPNSPFTMAISTINIDPSINPSYIFKKQLRRRFLAATNRTNPRKMRKESIVFVFMFNMF